MHCYTTNTSVTSWNHTIAVARIPFNIILGCLLLMGLIGNSVAIHVCRLKQKREIQRTKDFRIPDSDGSPFQLF
ncbi:uncharacterized protein LOC111134067 isoform X2 [Crassostrea virginica]